MRSHTCSHTKRMSVVNTRRLNDMGKNWRHCYKGLLLLDYLLKTGADHVVTEVRANKFAIETLLEFQ